MVVNMGNKSPAQTTSRTMKARTVKRSLSAAIAAALLSASMPSNANAMGMKNAPCDGFYDCIATAWWYAFYK